MSTVKLKKKNNVLVINVGMFGTVNIHTNIRGIYKNYMKRTRQSSLSKVVFLKASSHTNGLTEDKGMVTRVESFVQIKKENN